MDAVVEAGLRRHVFPGAVVCVGTGAGGIAHLRGFGRFTYAADGIAVQSDTIYDLASLTKILVATMAAMMLADDGLVDVSAPVRAAVPEFSGGLRDRVTLAHLLSHSSGLPGWAPLYRDASGRDEMLGRIASFDLEREPGEASVYSDLGFIVLGIALERLAGTTLDVLAAGRIFGPLGMTDTAYRPDAALRPRIAPTEDDPWRGRRLQGEVHDENAHALGGVAAHAGVFGTASDLARFARLILAGGRWEGRWIVRRETLDRFAALSGVPGSSFGLGWDHPSGAQSAAGAVLSRSSIGHLGFTGTSVWMDREHDQFVILLSNSVHPTRGNQGLRETRAAVADAAARALRG